MPGTYAPPAVELPNTSAMVGCRRALARVRSRNSLPPGMKISFCVGRSAPPDSTSEIVGRWFSSAICAARKAFFTVHGLLAPPLTVGSLAVIRHSTPSTTPMPVTSEAPTAKSEPQPASGDSSRNAEPGSTRSSIRSRGRSFPRSWWRSTYVCPPPPTAFACSASRSASFSSIASRLVMLDHRLHPLERGAHPRRVGPAAERTEHQPVRLQRQRRSELEVLGDEGAVAVGLEPVAPAVDRPVQRPVDLDHELEDLVRHALGDATGRPVRRADAVALHVTLEPGPDLGPGRAASPSRLERLGRELPD